MKKAFLICPVRGHMPEETEEIVRNLESEGWQVYWPPRDTNQDDPTGYTICQQNRDAIKDADRVFMIWDGKSEGCLFDLGMVFAFGKPIKAISLPNPSDGKSFQNMIRDWESRSCE